MKFQLNKAVTPEVDMTPMIDIVFQLIIFFMLVINFEQTQADERVKLPKDTLAKPPEVTIAHELVINIGFKRDLEGERLDPDPFIFLAGEECRVLEYGRRLQQEYRLYDAKKTDPTDVTVSIRADAEVPAGVVQELIRLAQQAGGNQGGFHKFAIKATQTID